MKTPYTKKVIKALREFEFSTEKETGVSKFSGGFAIAEPFDYDDEWIDIELTWGIQSDCQSTVHTEQWKLNRKSLEFETA